MFLHLFFVYFWSLMFLLAVNAMNLILYSHNYVNDGVVATRAITSFINLHDSFTLVAFLIVHYCFNWCAFHVRVCLNFVLYSLRV